RQTVERRMNGVALPLALVVPDVEPDGRFSGRDVVTAEVLVHAEHRQRLGVEALGVEAPPVSDLSRERLERLSRWHDLGARSLGDHAGSDQQTRAQCNDPGDHRDSGFSCGTRSAGVSAPSGAIRCSTRSTTNSIANAAM